MAKAKNSKKTIEDALIPLEEYPYDVPRNWCWTRLSYVASWGSGGTPSRKKPEYYNGSIPWIKTGELCDGLIYDSEEKITEDAISKSSAKVFPVGSVLIAMYGATIGKTAILGIPASTNQACACANCREGIFNKYLFWYLQSQKDGFIAKGQGGAQPNISQEIIKKYPFPLPPQPEQQRIVEQIERLYSKLDEAKAKAELSLEGFYKRKEAILYKAFRGELTKKYRKHNRLNPATDYLNKLVEEGKTISRKDFCYWENSELPSGWVESKIGNLLYFAGRIGWKGLKAEEYTEEGPMFLSVYNLNDGDEVTYNRVYHITKERYEESPEIMVQVGDILLAKDGAGIGKLGYIKELLQEATINSSLLLIRPGEVADPKYVFYYLSGPELQDIVRERITGSATPHLFQRDIKEFLIPIPPMEEQREIVSILDDILSKEYRAYDAAKMTVEQVDLMKKAILANAFRGKLGTNDSSEESSIELLKRIAESESI